MVKELITAATPRLFKHDYNVRVICEMIWAVKGKLNRTSLHGQCNLEFSTSRPMARGSAGLIALLIKLDKVAQS